MQSLPVTAAYEDAADKKSTEVSFATDLNRDLAWNARWSDMKGLRGCDWV